MKITKVNLEIAVDVIAIFFGGWMLCILPFEIIVPSSTHTGAIDLFLGTIVWFVIFFFCGIAARCLKIVPDNEVWIVANSLRQERVSLGGNIDNDRIIRAQRAIQSGPNLTKPWEYLAPGGKVDMTKQSLGKETDPDSYSTKDKNQVEVEYELFRAVIPGEEVNYFRFHQSGDNKEIVATYLDGLFEGWLQGYCAKHRINELIGNLDAINLAFHTEFLSNRKLTATEKKMGDQIVDGAIFRVAPSKEIKEARQTVLKVTSTADAAKVLKERYPDLTDAQVMNLAVAIEQGSGVDIRDEHIEIKGLPPGLTFFNHGSHGESKPHGKNKGDKQGNKPQPPKP